MNQALDGSISIGRHGIRILFHDETVWLIDGAERQPFHHREHGGGRFAAKAAINEAEKRNQIRDQIQKDTNVQS